MMEIVIKILQDISNQLDWIIVLIVIASGIFQKKYIKYRLSKDDEFNGAWKTLVISFIASIVYIVAAKNPGISTNWAKFFVSYFAATSFYQIALVKLFSWLKIS